MSKHSDYFNSLPKDMRKKLSKGDAEMRINTLKQAKNYARAGYRHQIAKINSWIKNLEDYLEEG